MTHTPTDPLSASPPDRDLRVTIDMTETVTYRRTFTLSELAALLDTPATRADVLAALDTDNLDYGTRDPDDECLLDALLPIEAPVRHLLGIEDRSWAISWPTTRTTTAHDATPQPDSPR